MDNKQKSALSETLTKVLHQANGDGHAEHALAVVRGKLAALSMSLLDVRIEVGDQKELDEARHALNQHRSVAIRRWREFEHLAETKGYESLNSMAAAVRANTNELMTCKRQDTVPHNLYYALSEAPNLRLQKERRAAEQRAARAFVKQPKQKPSKAERESMVRDFDAQNPGTYKAFRELAQKASGDGELKVARDLLVTLRDQGFKAPQYMSAHYTFKFTSEHPQHAAVFQPRGKVGKQPSLPINGQDGAASAH